MINLFVRLKASQDLTENRVATAIYAWVIKKLMTGSNDIRHTLGVNFQTNQHLALLQTKEREESWRR